MGKNAPEYDDPVRCLVRVKSFRVHLLDERNLHEKAFVDALVQAGIIIDDSRRWCRVEVEQIQVPNWLQERTVIEVEPIYGQAEEIKAPGVH